MLALRLEFFITCAVPLQLGSDHGPQRASKTFIYFYSDLYHQIHLYLLGPSKIYLLIATVILYQDFSEMLFSISLVKKNT